MNDLPQINISIKKQYLYVWLDILGFSDILEREDRYSELIKLIKKFRDKFENTDEPIKTLAISDGIVLIFELKTIEDLKNVFTSISKLQDEFIVKEKYFLRGGMAIGTIYENEEDDNLKFLVSNALSSAYSTESKYIKWPIIGITQIQYNKLKTYFNINSEDLQFGLLKCHSYYSCGDEQFIYFIDYMDEELEFKKLIEKNLKENHSKPQVLEKYIWLYRYYREKYGTTEIDILNGVSV